MPKITCHECNGKGKVQYSCCGDRITGTMWEDYKLCPSCKEHLGDEEDDCENCKGTGEVEE